MNPWAAAVILIIAALATLVFSTLTFALRDYSRSKLQEQLERRRRGDLLADTMEHDIELAFITATGRLISNMLVLLGFVALFSHTNLDISVQYALALLCALIVLLVCSNAVPFALSSHVGEWVIGLFIRPLHLMRLVLAPIAKLMHVSDTLVRRAARRENVAHQDISDEVEESILQAVEEGAESGVVDPQERALIESVIEFGDVTVAQTMTARSDIIALPLDAEMPKVLATIEESGHSRVPLYDQTLDKIEGVIYARDLLALWGTDMRHIDLRTLMRKPLYVPETTLLRNVLEDFRMQKVHIAVVLDEYGGTAGLVTIEDVLEEIVGDISDEHEPAEPAMFKRIDDTSAEVDAKMYLSELNRMLGLHLPEDSGYDTMGGFVTSTLGRIPTVGTSFEASGVRVHVLAAEPTRVDLVRLEVLPESSGTTL